MSDSSYWNSPLIIAGKPYPRFISGPLDGITDSPFRRLVREFSKDELLYTEMRHVACIATPRAHVKALDYLQLERPLNFQIAANQLPYIASAIERILASGVDMVDLNVGCPASNVIGSGSGSALMADLPRLESIVRTLRSLLSIPFTVKIRAGFKCKNAIEVARMLEACGVDALAIHPRLQSQRFEGQPDYELAAQVKQAVSIPVIISGGIVNFKMASMVYNTTGVDGFLIGRGMWSKPWKLAELAAHCQGQPFSLPITTVVEYAIKHFNLMLEYYGPRGLFAFRKHLPFYLRGIPEATTLRKKLVVETSAQEILQALHSLCEK